MSYTFSTGVWSPKILDPLFNYLTFRQGQYDFDILRYQIKSKSSDFQCAKSNQNQNQMILTFQNQNQIIFSDFGEVKIKIKS